MRVMPDDVQQASWVKLRLPSVKPVASRERFTRKRLAISSFSCSV